MVQSLHNKIYGLREGIQCKQLSSWQKQWIPMFFANLLLFKHRHFAMYIILFRNFGETYVHEHTHAHNTHFNKIISMCFANLYGYSIYNLNLVANGYPPTLSYSNALSLGIFSSFVFRCSWFMSLFECESIWGGFCILLFEWPCNKC